MTSHQLAIAKASLLAGLLRPDPTPVSREESLNFHALLKAVTVKCSPENIQLCKQWTLENIYQSTSRSIALGKYLIAFTASLVESELKNETDSKSKPSIKRQCLHVLYLVNDILYHGKYRINDLLICSKIQPILVSLIGSCASFKGSPKHLSKLKNLILLWKEKNYFTDEFIDSLLLALENALETRKQVELLTDKEKKEGKTILPKPISFTMPASHGDPSTPWYDLPAGNLMPHIIPNSTRPINPDMIKPLQFVSGPADESLVSAVKKLLSDVDEIFTEEQENNEKTLWDIDELGQPIIIDEITGDIIDGEGYYGWSRNFCEKMKKRRNEQNNLRKGNHSEWQERSVNSSPEARKRRYSGSGESPIRSRRRRRSFNSSRSSSISSRSLSSHSRSNSRSRPRSPLRVTPSLEKISKSSPPKDEIPAQSASSQIPPAFQHSLNANFAHSLPLPNMNMSGPNLFGAWPPPIPPPLPFPIDPNLQQFGAWPPVPFPPQPGQMNQHPAPFPYPGPNGWQHVPNSNGHPFEWNGTQPGGHDGNRTRGW
ncbi:putative calcium homeostasis endoplasmic reticulum protein [Erysiphe necator]|uniref:Putative calcium homeostasis endoplasmic reticulum protein n=1 Tax=Uncinula necator TaxID=52586 RepID=A0A0B1P1D0_UNCNE|nr:putative calcium homeostasis endoplasmic reticulum protein [Erysiphe necator]